MLVPHPHRVAVVAVDMRGFSNLTRVLHDTQYLADLIGEYLTEMTEIIEAHRGVVFQYTGDGLLAIFLPELAGTDTATMLERVVYEAGRELHARFDQLNARWRADWRAGGREVAPIGLGVGVSFGRATIGLLGPSGKKQFGVIGEPVNQAAYLCSQAPAGTLVVERDAFARAGAATPVERVMRLRSKKRHQRIDTIRLHYGASLFRGHALRRAPRA
jgi:adenylate cyclase